MQHTDSARLVKATRHGPSQALLHAPVLRSYYLGGGHRREACRWCSATEPCLSCELVKRRSSFL